MLRVHVKRSCAEFDLATPSQNGLRDTYFLRPGIATERTKSGFPERQTLPFGRSSA